MNKKFNYALAYQLVNIFFPIAVLPYILRIFSANIYGEYILANIIYLIIFNFTCVSLMSYGVRVCGEKTEDVELMAGLGEILSIQMLLNICCLSLLLVFLLFNVVQVNANLMIIFFPSIFFQFVNVDWYYFFHRKYKYLFGRIALIKISSMALIFAFVKKDDDLYIYAAIMSSSYLLSNIIGFWGARKNINYKYISLHNGWKALNKVKYFLSSSAIGVGYQYIDQLIVGHVLGTSALAHLNILKQIFAIINVWPQTLCKYFAPDAIIFAQKKNIYLHNKNIFKKYFFSVVLISFLLSILGEYITPIIVGDNFSYSFFDFVLLSLFYIATSSAIYIDTQYSIPLKREKITTTSNLVVLCVSLSILISVMQNYSYTGALAALMIGEIAGVIIMVCYNIKKNNDLR